MANDPLPIDMELIQLACFCIPQQPQKQYSTAEQLAVLLPVANRLGLYDAADALRNDLKAIGFKEQFG